MTPKLTFRDARKRDLTDLQELVDELYLDDAGPDADVPAVAVSYDTLKGRKNKGRLVVFERGGDLIGYAIIIFFWSNEFAGDIVNIDEILVTKRFRGTGVASAFFRWLKREYNGSTCGWSLEVRISNKKAERLYKRVGFRRSANALMYRIF